MLPNGGPPNGGTKILLSEGSGLEGATAAPSARPLRARLPSSQTSSCSRPHLQERESYRSASSRQEGRWRRNFNYFAVTGLSANAGPATGGNTITIKGTGFNEVKGVEIGLMPAQSFKVVNESEITAEVPLGLGTVDVQVVDGFATSQQSVSTQYT